MRSAFGWHVTSATDDRQLLFPTRQALHHALLRIASILGDKAALFCIVDDHLHLVFVGSRRLAGIATRSLRNALPALTSAPLDETFFRRIRDRAHMRTLTRYLHRQASATGLNQLDVLWQGSSLLDLVGARTLPGLSLNLFEALPRQRPCDILAGVGLSPRFLPLPRRSWSGRWGPRD